MSETRAEARKDFTALFANSFDKEIDELLTMWWRPETQTALRAILEQLSKRKQSSAARL
jgi:hypothetical protein